VRTGINGSNIQWNKNEHANTR